MQTGTRGELKRYNDSPTVKDIKTSILVSCCVQHKDLVTNLITFPTITLDLI